MMLLIVVEEKAVEDSVVAAESALEKVVDETTVAETLLMLSIVIDNLCQGHSRDSGSDVTESGGRNRRGRSNSDTDFFP